MPASLIAEIAAGNAPLPATWTSAQFEAIKGCLGQSTGTWELIDGLILPMDGQTTSNAEGTIERMVAVLTGAVEAKECHVRQLLGLAIADDQQPAPAIAVVRGQPIRYAAKLPTAGQTALVVEVSSSPGGAYQKIVKQRIYAAAGLPLFWIFDPQGWTIECFTVPLAEQGRYMYSQLLHAGDQTSVRLGSTGSVTLTVDSLLGQAALC